MGQILSSSKSGNETTSRKKETSLPSRVSSQYSFDSPQWKNVSTFSTSQSSYDTEWLRRKIIQQEVERLKQARQAREAREAREQEAERLRQARQARQAREQEMEKLKQARQAKEAREREAIKLYLAKQQEKVSQISKSTTSSERKLTSGTKDNNTTHVPYKVVTISGIKTASGVTSGVTPGSKVNTISLSHSPSVEKKETKSPGIKNPTSSDLYNISSKSEENTTSLSKEDRENIKRINEIVRNILARNKNYVVYGNWSCPHWPISCNNEYEWQCKYSLESLRRYLKLNQKDKKEFFMSKCKECDKKSLITSFFLYDQQPNVTNKMPNVEIVCRLEWNNHYRVFAEWKCNRPQHPQHKWKSSYTWISLRNYIEKSSLKKGDYYVQKCHDCREGCKACKNKPKEKRGCEKCDHDTVILSHSQLLQSPGGKPHKRWLCAKCKGGSICRSDNNYRIPRKRNIELF